jgi:acyl carrier protein
MQTPESSVIPERLRNVLADVFDIPADQITPDLGPGSIDAWDSYGHLQVVLAVEAEYGIQFPPEMISKLNSVAHLREQLLARGVTT